MKTNATGTLQTQLTQTKPTQDILVVVPTPLVLLLRQVLTPGQPLLG